MTGPIPVPTFTRLEYMNPRGEWVVGHAGIALLDPEGYVRRLTAKGKIARATCVDTGVVFQTEGAELI